MKKEIQKKSIKAHKGLWESKGSEWVLNEIKGLHRSNRARIAFG